MIDFSKAIPERLAMARKAELNERYGRLVADAFGGLDDDLGKVTHIFQVGDRVEVHNPQSNHHVRGHLGTITDQRGDYFHVRLDSGQDVQVYQAEIRPEDFAAPGEISDKILKSLNPTPVDDDGSTDALAKRAKSKFELGQKIRVNGEAAVVTKIDPAGLAFERGPGRTGFATFDVVQPA